MLQVTFDPEQHETAAPFDRALAHRRTSGYL
jgi:hypothetical protein